MAAEYDVSVGATIPNYDRLHVETIGLVSILKPNPRKWLDTGCGTGTMVAKAMQSFRETEFVLADPSKAMLDISAGKLSPSCGDRLKIAAPISTEALTFPDSAFDVITAIECHHYLDLETRRRATANCFRMLEHRGVYISFENTRPQSEIGTRIGLERWKVFQVEAGRSVTDAEAHIARFGIEYFPITVSEHLELLNHVGFETFELFWMSYLQAGFYAIKRTKRGARSKKREEAGPVPGRREKRGARSKKQGAAGSRAWPTLGDP